MNIQSYFTEMTYDSMNKQVSSVGFEIENRISSIEDEIIFDVLSGMFHGNEKSDLSIKRFLLKYKHIVNNIYIYDREKAEKFNFDESNHLFNIKFKDNNYIMTGEVKIIEESGLKYIIVPFSDANGVLIRNYKIELDIEWIIRDFMKEFYINGEYWTWYINDKSELIPIEYSETNNINDRFTMSKLDFIKKEIQDGYKGFLKNEIMYDNYNSVSTSYYPVFFHEYKYGIGVSVYYISLIKEITIKVSSLIFVFIIMMILIIFYFTILIDNEKKIAANLNESERSINKIINYVPFGIVLYDSNIVVRSNDYAKNELGIIEGKTSNIIVNKFLELNNEDGNEGIVKFKTKNGKEKSVFANLTTIVYEKKEVNFLSFVDITIVNEAKELAEESNRIKSRFVATVSHEIRTPMNGIIASVELLESIDIDNEEARNYIKIVKSSSENLLSMVNDILEMSKIENGRQVIKNTWFNLFDLINSIFLQFVSLIDEEKINYHILIDDELPKNVRSDENKIRQILINIIGNAIKFTHDGEIFISVKQKNRVNDMIEVEFVIADTGIGIKEDKLEKIFLKFYQIEDTNKRSYQGSGLGTTIAKELVELLGGKIKAFSPNRILKENNIGFEIIIDLNMEFKDTIIIENAEKINIHSKKYKILLAEDNVINAKITKKILNNAGYDVTVVSNGQEVIDIFDSSYDIILMDIQMPIKDGFEATKEIRNIDKNVFIVALTANDYGEINKKVKEVGMDQIVVKPFSKEKIYHIMKKITTNR